MKLGLKARCKVTGYVGILTAKCQYLNGCTQYCLTPKHEEGKDYPTGNYLDEDQIEIIYEQNPIDIKGKPTGGPQHNCPTH